MKRITLRSLAGLTLVTALATQALATPNPNSAVVHQRVFNDCPFTTLSVVNNYPSLISIEDSGLACSAFANLHTWRLSTDGATAAGFPNNSDFRVSADLVISGTGKGEAGLNLSPWFSPDADGKFNVRTTDGEIACFGGRMPFYTFTGTYGLHYVKGTPIHLQMTYKPHGLSASSPATMEYELDYAGTHYSSGELNFDQGNAGEDPPHGLWGLLNDGYVGGFVQPNMEPGNFSSALKGSFTNIRFVICPIEPDPTTATLNLRFFNDCPPASITTINNYPSQIQFTESGLACSAFANLDLWTYADAAGQETVINNDEDFRIACDFMLAGKGEGGLRVSPWFSHYADGLFNVRSTDGEIACFGGRIPFYTFTGNFGLHYAMGNPIHLEIVYKHNGLSSVSPGTIQYNLTYLGTSYTSGALSFDLGNAGEDPPHGLWGVLNDARAGGHMKAFMTPGDFSATTVGTFSNIEFQSGTVAGLDITPGSLNFKSNGNYVTAHLTPPAGYSPSDFEAGELRLNGVTGPTGTPEIDGNTLVVKFSRAAFQAVVQGDGGTATVTGGIGGFCFTSSDQVRTSHVSAPSAGSVHVSHSALSVHWDVADMAGSPVDIYSSVDGGESWSQLASGVGNTGSYDVTTPDGESNEALIAVSIGNGDVVGISDAFTISANPVGVGDVGAVEFALKGISPNPSNNGQGVNVVFSLPNTKQASLALYDVTGRRVAFREVGLMGSGRHTVKLAQRLPAGVYVVRLSQDGRSLSARASVVR